ncbi:hypothetical protein HanIR_Chr01g0013451 [Helianthus annuus]|nr:hypothetical protein HanIR_Chr01g0013451 [Helianthus annuus]
MRQTPPPRFCRRGEGVRGWLADAGKVIERGRGYCGWGPFLSQPITTFPFVLNGLPLHQVSKPLPTLFTKI